jgi:hypothetical protein
MGYRVKPAPMGYVNVKIDTEHDKRVVLQTHPVESPWFIRMFEIRELDNLSDEQIVAEINRMEFKSRRIHRHNPEDKTKVVGYAGERPPSVKQFQRYIQNPIYAGVNTEKWTDGQPIKTKFKGLVSIDTFNKANRGKIVIVEDGESVRIFKGKIPQWLLKKQKDNPLYPYRKYILCPICKSPLLGSVSRGKLGKHYPAYHCQRTQILPNTTY